MSIAAILAEPIPPLTPMGAHMLDCERRDGRTPITPGECPVWLNISDWWPWPVLAIADGELHIIAINARVEGQGAFRRLLESAKSAGLSPVVCEPMGPAMPAILAKWGWRRTITGEGWNAREEWRAS